MRAFQDRHPNVALEAATGLDIPNRTMDTVPLMQIAADISPAVIYVNFRQSSTYIDQKFLYPLDRYLEAAAGVALRDSHRLDTPAYVAALRRGRNYAGELEARLAPQTWEVIRRECPYREDCPYVQEWGGTTAAKHSHVWALPESQMVMALFYRKDLFAEAGLPERAPRDMDEFLGWARRMHNPKDNVHGINIPLGETAWSTLSFFYSSGARAVAQDTQGIWRCVFNSPQAVDAYYYVSRMFLESFTNAHGRFEGVVNVGEQRTSRYAMWFSYLDSKVFDDINAASIGFGPVPVGANGVRGSEFNARMAGLYAGYEKDVPLRDAAWAWLFHIGSREAAVIRANVYAENGLERFVQPELLVAAGYPELVSTVPPGWAESAREALENGIPEPYGRNCQMVYAYMTQAINQMRGDDEVKRCIAKGDEAGAKKRIQEILNLRVAIANRKMLNILPENVKRFQIRVAAAAAMIFFAIFTLVLRAVFLTFSKNMLRSDLDLARGSWQFGRHKLAYLMLIPALLSVAVWSYWPLLRGTAMAFQDYNVRGFSTWVGLENFATVLFSPAFWFAMYVSLKYTVLYMSFGFVAPIMLALLLSEVPRGKILFRTLYYLPAVLSGVVVIFLWKGFYGQHGMINQVLNLGVQAINTVAGTHLREFTTEWLTSPKFALFFCLLPSIWAGMGPGCLIYLAALKGIPTDLYEAADIDGAGAAHKVRYITIPSIRALISINFIGAAIGCMHSGSSFIMAMTGGGPYAPYGATEVIGLHLFWEAFGYLRFGVATAMAWVLGSMLIGFTVNRLKQLSRMEFKAAGGQ
jgi:multiple sugar transport system permease protein